MARNRDTDGEQQSEQRLFCFGFDRTIVKGHFHQALTTAGSIPGEVNPLAINELFDNPDFGLKDGDKVGRIIREALRNGHKVAITAHTHYPEVIPIALERMGLTKQEIAQVHIVTGFSEIGDLPGKNSHIEAAIEDAELQGIDPSKVTLIDSNDKDIKAATGTGYKTVQVPLRGNLEPVYLDSVLQDAQIPARKDAQTRENSIQASQSETKPRRWWNDLADLISRIVHKIFNRKWKGHAISDSEGAIAPTAGQGSREPDSRAEQSQYGSLSPEAQRTVDDARDTIRSVGQTNGSISRDKKPSASDLMIDATGTSGEHRPPMLPAGTQSKTVQ